MTGSKAKGAVPKELNEPKAAMENFKQELSERVAVAASDALFPVRLQMFGWPADNAARVAAAVPEAVRLMEDGPRGIHDLIMAVCLNVKRGRKLNAFDLELFEVALREMVASNNEAGRRVHDALRAAGQRDLLNMLYMVHYESMKKVWLGE